MATTAVAHATISTLRREIARIEGRLPEQLAPSGTSQDATVLRHDGAAERQGAFIATGAERLDRALGGGLPKAALTEIHGSETRNAGGAAAFTLALAGLTLKTSGNGMPLLWIGSAEIFREAGFPYVPGLVHQFGIAPEHLLFSEVPKLADLLWVAEEAASLPELAAVIVELRGNPERLDLTATRRLNRRAEQAGRPVFLIRQAAAAEPTAAPVRLVVGPAPAAPRRTLAGPLPGSIGAPAFSVTIGKSRAAPAGEFIVEWNSHDLSLRERRVEEGRTKDARRLVSLSRPGEDLAAAPGKVMAFPWREEAAVGHEPPRPEHATYRGRRRAGRGSQA